MTGHLAKLDRVTKRYRSGRYGLQDATLAIPRCRVAGLIGPNGAGKSTVIQLLQGVIKPTRGTVCLLGTRITDGFDRALRRRVGVLPQNSGYFDDVSVRELLRLSQRVYASGSIMEAAAQFGLTSHLNARLAQLSGGLQRRALLAAALLPRPELLLLDEPTLGLDPLAARDLHELIAAHGRTGAVLMATNNLQEAEVLCDYLVIIDHGSVLLEGLRDELLAHSPLEALFYHAVAGQAT